MKIIEGINQKRANATAFEQLMPKERLIWAGKEKLTGLKTAALIFVVPPLAVLTWQLIVKGPYVSLVGAAVYLGVFLLLYVAAVRARQNRVFALTNKRIMIINPEKSVRWFWTSDVKDVISRVSTDGTGSVLFRFNKPVQPKTKDLTFSNITDGNFRTFDDVAVTEFHLTGLTDAAALKTLKAASLKSSDELRPSILTR